MSSAPIDLPSSFVAPRKLARKIFLPERMLGEVETLRLTDDPTQCLVTIEPANARVDGPGEIQLGFVTWRFELQLPVVQGGEVSDVLEHLLAECFVQQDSGNVRYHRAFNAHQADQTGIDGVFHAAFNPGIAKELA